MQQLRLGLLLMEECRSEAFTPKSWGKVGLLSRVILRGDKMGIRIPIFLRVTGMIRS
jgi:hypothetical protein